MRNRTSTALTYASVWAVALSLAACPSCTGMTARQKALLPTMRIAWAGVKADIERGEPQLTVELEALDSALLNGNVAAARAVSWAALAATANAGITKRVAEGKLSDGAALSLRERIRAFGDALAIFCARG